MYPIPCHCGAAAKIMCYIGKSKYFKSEDVKRKKKKLLGLGYYDSNTNTISD